MSEDRRSVLVIRPDGVVVEAAASDNRFEPLPCIVMLSRYMARRLARELNDERPSPLMRFEVERLGLLRWRVVACFNMPIAAEGLN